MKALQPDQILAQAEACVKSLFDQFWTSSRSEEVQPDSEATSGLRARGNPLTIRPLLLGCTLLVGASMAPTLALAQDASGRILVSRTSSTWVTADFYTQPSDGRNRQVVFSAFGSFIFSQVGTPGVQVRYEGILSNQFAYRVSVTGLPPGRLAGLAARNNHTGQVRFTGWMSVPRSGQNVFLGQLFL